MAHYAEAFRVGEHFAAVAEKASCGNFEFEFGCTSVIRRHVDEFALSCADFVHDRADVFVGDFDDEVFHRFVGFAVDFLEDNLRAGNLKFVTLSSHVLDEN